MSNATGPCYENVRYKHDSQDYVNIPIGQNKQPEEKKSKRSKATVVSIVISLISIGLICVLFFLLFSKSNLWSQEQSELTKQQMELKSNLTNKIHQIYNSISLLMQEQSMIKEELLQQLQSELNETNEIFYKEHDMKIEELLQQLQSELNKTNESLTKEQNMKIQDLSQQLQSEFNKTNENLIKEQNMKIEELLQLLRELNTTIENIIEEQNMKIEELLQQVHSELNKTNENLIEGFIELHDGWVSPLYNGFQYKYFNISKSWNEARNSCHNLGGDLASQGMKNIEIRRILAKALGFNHSNVWIGLSDLSGNWTYITSYPSILGEIATNSTGLWLPGHPYPNNGVTYYYCAFMSSMTQLSLSTLCTNYRKFLCEKTI